LEAFCCPLLDKTSGWDFVFHTPILSQDILGKKQNRTKMKKIKYTTLTLSNSMLLLFLSQEVLVCFICLE
jgi:hypothetical protein